MPVSMPQGSRPRRWSAFSLSTDKLRTARKLYEQKDMTIVQISEVLGVRRATAYRSLRKETGALPPRGQEWPRTYDQLFLRKRACEGTA